MLSVYMHYINTSLLLYLCGTSLLKKMKEKQNETFNGVDYWLQKSLTGESGKVIKFSQSQFSDF